MRYPLHAGPPAEEFERVCKECSEETPKELEFLLGGMVSQARTKITVTEMLPLSGSCAFSFQGFRNNLEGRPIALKGVYNPYLQDGSIEFLSNPPEAPKRNS